MEVGATKGGVPASLAFIVIIHIYSFIYFLFSEIILLVMLYTYFMLMWVNVCFLIHVKLLPVIYLSIYLNVSLFMHLFLYLLDYYFPAAYTNNYSVLCHRCPWEGWQKDHEVLSRDRKMEKIENALSYPCVTHCPAAFS